AMTAEMIKVFPKRGGKFQIEPDASSGSYFVGAGILPPHSSSPYHKDELGVEVLANPSHAIKVAHWPASRWQIDGQFLGMLVSSGLALGLKIQPGSNKLPATVPQPGEISRTSDLGDSIMTAIALAPLSNKPTRFTDLGRLRVQ